MNFSNRVKTLVVVVIGSVVLNGCMQGGGGGDAKKTDGAAAPAASGGGTGVVASGGSETPTNLIAQQTTNVGLKNFDQINESFSVLTGVNAADVANPVTIGGVSHDGFNNIRSSLPLNNDLRSYGGAVQVAVFKLAARYCYRAIRDNPTSAFDATMRARNHVLPANLLVGAATVNVNNLTQTPAQLFTPANNAKIADYFIEQFWHREMNAPANMDDQNIVQLIGELAVGEAANSTSTLNVLVGACTAALANSNAFMM